MVLTPAVAGAASLAVFAGAAAPADLAGTDVPAIAEKELSAVAEDYSLADNTESSPLVIRVSKQLVSGWSILRIPGIGRMIDRAIQMTVLPRWS